MSTLPSSSFPSPDTVLRRRPGAQAVALPDGRQLIRHAGGLSVLGGPSMVHLPRLLSLVDGRRSLGEIAEILADEIPPGEVANLARSVLGELLEEVEPAQVAPPGPRPEIALFARAGTAERLSLLLREAGLAGLDVDLRLLADGEAEGLGAGTSLAVVAREEVPYGALFSLQSALLTRGVPNLYLTADPDGLRLGPLTVPGVSPCFACAQLAAQRPLGLPAREALAVAGGFEALAFSPELLARAAPALAGEIAALLSPAAAPVLLSRALLVTGGGIRPLPIERSPDCPLCRGLEPDRAGLAERAVRVVAEATDRVPARALPVPDDGFVRSVGILGGGTAGYLAALALRRKAPYLEITLLESSDVPIIGVGEATTPLMPQFLHVDLGLDIHRLFREVQPTLKLGIRFLWGLPESGDFHYPFGPLHVLEPQAYGEDFKACSLQSLLMEAEAAPVYHEGEGWASSLGVGTAYHLDNERFVAYLKRRAEEAGVARVEAKIVAVERGAGEDGAEEVAALVAADGRRFSFDLYLDATGFRSLLLEETLGSPWIGFDNLWTDRAVVAPVPHGGRVRPYTTAETMSCGWCWSTPQGDADHRGYVFSSAFQTPAEAEEEMRGKNPGMGAARLVRFRAGRHAHFFRGNVVALGNAYGFVEPLESTALHMLIRQIGLLVRAFPLRRGERALPLLWNRQVGSWWDYLAWFLALHYRFNRRLDRPFWQACREGIDLASHGELLEAFRERGPLSYDPAIQAAFDYPDPLWGPEGIDTLLLGQGVRPCRLPRPALAEDRFREHVQRARATAARALPHEQALALFAERPELLEGLARAFRAAGPAFG